MNEQAIDLKLVDEVKKGNKHAFDILVLKYQNKLLKLVNRYIYEPNEAKDVVQETFIKAYRALPKFQGKSGFYTWLYRIAVNTAKNHLIHQHHLPPNNDISIEKAEQLGAQNLLKDYNSPEGLLVRDELEAAIYDAVNSLPEDLKTAIILRELTGLSYADIAKVMNCPLGTVRSRIFRARELVDEKLKSILDQNGEHSHG